MPLLSVAITPRVESDRENLLRALDDLVHEFWTAESKSDFKSGKIVLGGDSELDLQIICHRIAHDYKIGIDVGEMKVAFRETVRRSAEGEGKYIRQTGGMGNYGHCKLRVEPNEPGMGYEFISEIENGSVPVEFIKPIDQGVQDALALGILAGHPMVDVKVTLIDGSFHQIDSNEIAFKFAGSIAFKEAARKANPVLLEPVMFVEVTVPEEHLGTIIGEINSRRGRVEGTERHLVSIVVKALIPLAELLHVSKLGGHVYSMRFARHEEVMPGGGTDGFGAGITANKPGGPTGKSGSTSVKPNEESE